MEKFTLMLCICYVGSLAEFWVGSAEWEKFLWNKKWDFGASDLCMYMYISFSLEYLNDYCCRLVEERVLRKICLENIYIFVSNTESMPNG